MTLEDANLPMAARDVGHWPRQLQREMDWEGNFAQHLETACDGIDPCISIHVFGHERDEASAKLLRILEASNYTGYEKPLPLVIHLDGPAVPTQKLKTLALKQLAENFEWTHGPKILDVHNENRGLKASWLNAWTLPRPNDVMIAFEDDVLPSPFYFQWLVKVLEQYDLLNGDSRDPCLLGVSLSPMRMDEITYPFRKWMTHENIPSQYPVFLHAVPSSWGVAYFGRPWRDFLDFVAVRAAPPFYAVQETGLNLTGYGWHTKRGDPNLWLPNSRSNNWVHSWKRYMIDFAYGRGAYMLYPNLGNSSGLATSTFMKGAHVPTDNYRNPRYAPLADEIMLGLAKPWPPYSKLPVVDMHGEKSTRRHLSLQGDQFLENILKIGKHYAKLIKLWRRTCLLDTIYSSAMDTDFSTENRFLVASPQMGLSNQLIATMYSAVWAHTLDRTLVLPYIIWPRASQNHEDIDTWVSFHELFDPSGIIDHLPGLEIVYPDIEAMTERRPKRLTIIEPEPIFDKLHDTYTQAFDWEPIPRVDLIPYRPILNTSESVYQHLGSCQDEVLFLNGLYKNPQIDELPEMKRRSLWKSLFRPTPMVRHLIDRIVAGINRSSGVGSNSTKYGCLHVRQGDFSAVCRASSDVAPWLSNIYDKGRRCNVSLDDIMEKAKSLNMDNLVILSDDTIDMNFTWSGAQRYKLTSTDIRSLVESTVSRIRPNPSKALLDVVSAVTEQHVCALADRVVLNAFSTFSRAISFYRTSHQGVEYW